MADEQVQGQVPDAGSAPEAERPQPVAAQAGSEAAQEAEDEQFDAAYVRKLRAEAAEYRKRLRELEKVVREAEESKLGEVERLQRRLAELERAQLEWERERQERTLRYEVMLAAQRHGIVDPEAAYRLLDLSRVEFDDEGRPANLDKVLRALVAERPWLAGRPAVSPTNPGRAGVPGIEDAVRAGDPSLINQAFDAILRARRK
ncbi:hypothetical protein HRbin27_00062 [bacterium HR27]|nr:hypothetical protein HRbin27_00062 [bacterium HR27]